MAGNHDACRNTCGHGLKYDLAQLIGSDCAAYPRHMLKDSHAMAGHDAPAQEQSKRRRASRKARARAVLDRAPPAQGWKTTDADELELRRWRGRTEVSAIEALEPKHPIFGTFRIRSESGNSYEVEIRSLDQHTNSCGCIDHRVNGLGTCKHIEGALAALRRQDAQAFDAAVGAGSARMEIFLDSRTMARPALARPASGEIKPAARDWLRPFLKSSGELNVDPGNVAKLLAAWHSAPAHIRRDARVSRHFGPWIERQQRQQARINSRAKFIAEVERGKASFDLVKLPLLPYQREGMLHLAFGERALLADEMGLGKTVQAIAACELLARRKGIAKVLVVCPASLKAEWEEQIAHFTDRSAKSVFGPRAQRLSAYGEPVFFNIVNYEQVLVDSEDINQILAPDVIILDEAQRIKNWQTKTARRVKQLRAPHAFVLTGTPLENRIDELYSIVQYLDPELVGPLFRFNRQFYQLDERGRPVDYKNLGQLRDRVAPIMLRRRKADVEAELPGRTVTNYFVPMAEEQRTRYEEYKAQAARIVAIAQRRPLLPKEFERLQMLLACMRMICDTPAILDPTCRISPKLEELERILGDLLEEPDRKVIVFSEWERMLEMVRELAGEMGIEAAWHTGSVPQQRRRAEIVRFKQDPACRLFLSTDSGSVGLNLQVASAVVNVDLPWNPAKLEQRIARAWRKGQVRGVTVVNLVCEDSIEHGMVHLLGAKQALADGVLDGRGDLAALKMPSGRGAMIERMQALMQAADSVAARDVTRHPAPPEEAIAAQLQRRHGERMLLVEAQMGTDGRVRVLAVLDLDRQALQVEAKRLVTADDGGPVVEVIDPATWITLRRLQASGMIQFTDGAPRVLHRAAALADTEEEDAANALKARLAALRAEAERALRMAGVLADGGFPEEARPLLGKAIGHSAAIRLASLGELPAGVNSATSAQIRDLVDRKEFPLQASAALTVLDATSGAPLGAEIEQILMATAEILSACIECAEAVVANMKVQCGPNL
jgi:superfamily II DNA or RNA helicase